MSDDELCSPTDAGMTIAEVCEAYGVTPKTVREWIQQGLPVLRSGRRGPNGAALIDGARLHWWKHHRDKETIGKAFAAAGMPCGGNMLRWLCELLHQQQQRAIGVVLAGEGDRLRAAGVPAGKVGDLLATLWTATVLAMDVYLKEQFEKDLRTLTQADLDGWASALLSFNFRTTWTPGDQVAMPDEIWKRITPALRSRLHRRAGGSE